MYNIHLHRGVSLAETLRPASLTALRSRSVFGLFPVAILIAALGAGPALGKSVNESRPAPADGTVKIENIAGSLTVVGWDKNEVSVQGEMGDDAELEFRQDGATTRIKVKWEREHKRHWSLSDEDGAMLEIHLPQGSEVDVQTVSAPIDVSKVRGEVSAESVSGHVRITDEPARVRVECVSGDVDVLARTKRVKAESVSGRVVLSGPEGEASVSSVSGEIRIEGGSFQRLDAEVVSGDILFQGAFTSGANAEFSSHSGTVELEIPGNSSVEFEASTFSGDIVSEFGGKVRKTSEYAPGKELDLTIGAGDASVEASSFSGTVRLSKK